MSAVVVVKIMKPLCEYYGRYEEEGYDRDNMGTERREEEEGEEEVKRSRQKGGGGTVSGAFWSRAVAIPGGVQDREGAMGGDAEALGLGGGVRRSSRLAAREEAKGKRSLTGAADTTTTTSPVRKREKGFEWRESSASGAADAEDQRRPKCIKLAARIPSRGGQNSGADVANVQRNDEVNNALDGAKFSISEGSVARSVDRSNAGLVYQYRLACEMQCEILCQINELMDDFLEATKSGSNETEKLQYVIDGLIEERGRYLNLAQNYLQMANAQEEEERKLKKRKPATKRKRKLVAVV